MVSSSGNVVSNSTSSVPIATSTPVNLPAPGVGGAIVSPAPPPLSASGLAADGGARGSYPAVLKGRTGASPPNPNLVPSGKIPPPVPPRGSAASGRSRPDDHRGTASSSSSTSGRGDDASNACKLHESARTGAPLASDNVRASGEPPREVRTSLHENFSQRPVVRSQQRVETIDEEPRRCMHESSFNFVGSTSRHGVAGKATVASESFLAVPREVQYYRPAIQQREFVYSDVRYRYEQEEDEFVSVERCEDSFTIRTSASPFRPERGRYRFARSNDNDRPDDGPEGLRRPVDDWRKIKARQQSGEDRYAETMKRIDNHYVDDCRKMRTKERSGEERYAQTMNKFDNRSVDDCGKVRANEQSGEERYAETMKKFTYFINPGGNSYKMSRKDKKHSETYAERMRREQAEDSSQTSMGRMKIGVIMKNPEIFIRPASLVTPAARLNRVAKGEDGRDNEDRSILNSNRRNKRIAPSPSITKQIFTDLPKAGLGNSLKSEKRSSIRRVEQRIDYLRHAERDRIIENMNDREIVERKTIESCRSVRSAISESSLSSRRKKSSTRSLASGESNRERRHSVRRTTSMKVSTPNIRMENERKPETLKSYMSDSEYKDYLVETSSGEDVRGAPQNFSFLHGYASTRTCK